jgi:hypothetical protein
VMGFRKLGYGVGWQGMQLSRVHVQCKALALAVLNLQLLLLAFSLCVTDRGATSANFNK